MGGEVGADSFGLLGAGERHDGAGRVAGHRVCADLVDDGEVLIVVEVEQIPFDHLDGCGMHRGLLCR